MYTPDKGKLKLLIHRGEVAIDRLELMMKHISFDTTSVSIVKAAAKVLIVIAIVFGILSLAIIITERPTTKTLNKEYTIRCAY